MITFIFILVFGWMALSNIGDILAGLLGFKGIDNFIGYWGAMIFVYFMLWAIF